MTREEAIEVLKANYPSSCYSELCEAVDMAIKALEVQEGDCWLKCEFASPCLYCKHAFEEKEQSE